MDAVAVILERPPRVGKFHYYRCGSYLKGGKKTCAARLINKNKLESAVLANVQEQILTPNNIRNYIQRVMESALKSQDNPRRSKRSSDLALSDLQTGLQRWENALESGALSIEQAERIKDSDSHTLSYHSRFSRLFFVKFIDKARLVEFL